MPHATPKSLSTGPQGFKCDRLRRVGYLPVQRTPLSRVAPDQDLHDARLVHPQETPFDQLQQSLAAFADGEGLPLGLGEAETVAETTRLRRLQQLDRLHGKHVALEHRERVALGHERQQLGVVGHRHDRGPGARLGRAHRTRALRIAAHRRGHTGGARLVESPAVAVLGVSRLRVGSMPADGVQEAPGVNLSVAKDL
jgi:hypothetical protein